MKFWHPINPFTWTRGELQYHQMTGKEAALLSFLAIFVGILSALLSVTLNITVHSTIDYLSRLHSTVWMILLPAAGAALSAMYLRYLLRDDSGHGIPDLIRSATQGGGIIRRDMIYSRLISSFLTVASGGSAGLEGPVATSGGAIGSAIGAIFGLNERRRKLMLAYGTAGAIAAVFNAPLTGTVFALEVILGEWSTMAILPSVISAVTATQVSRLLMGNQIVFLSEIKGFQTLDLLGCVVLGIGTGLVSVSFSRLLNFSEHHVERLKIPIWIKAAAGGLLVGIGGYFVPAILHDGYDTVQSMLHSTTDMDLKMLFVFVILKLIAVVFTLSSGGSGGVFAPSLVMGSAMGYGYGKLIQRIFPMLSFLPSAAYGLVGMAGMVAGVMHAPLTGMFLVLEITGGYRMVLPLMITSVTSMIISHYFEAGSVYTRGIIESGQLVRKGSDSHLLEGMRIEELLDAESVVIQDDMLLRDFVNVFKKARRNIFPVVEHKTGRWLGVVNLDDIRPYLFESSLYSLMTMGEVMQENLPIIDAEDSALSAIQKFESSGAWSLPVISEGKFLGMISKSTIFDKYRRELIVHSD